MAQDSKRTHRSAPTPADSAAADGAKTAPNPLDAFRGAGSRDIVPWWVLVIIFVVLWIFILALMAPPFNREFTRFRSLRYEKTGDFQAAIGQLMKLYAVDKENPSVLSELGACNSRLQNHEEAVKWYKLAQENKDKNQTKDDEKPRPVDFSSQIGLSYLALGDLDNAEKYFKEGLKFDKLDKQANFGMGEIAFKRGNMKEATEYLKMVARDPAYKDRVKETYSKIEAQLFSGVK
jgi:tetratricopeptide (TPR) repeat protein